MVQLRIECFNPERMYSRGDNSFMHPPVSVLIDSERSDMILISLTKAYQTQSSERAVLTREASSSKPIIALHSSA